MDLPDKAAEKKRPESLVERAAEKMAKAAEAFVGPASPAPAAPLGGASGAAPAGLSNAAGPVHVVHPLDGAASAPHGGIGPGAAAMPRITPDERKARRSRRVEIDLASLAARHYLTPESEPTAMAEEFRIVKRSLLLNAFAKGPGAIRNGNLILVTSSQPGEGKTFCAVNLAMSMASERDTTVLLVDADTHKPEVLRTLGIEARKGLVDVVADESLDLADCLIRTNIENLALLPAGRQHNLTTELLASERMGVIVEDIAKRYPDRVVIFDSPPVLASSVASVLALHVGQILFIVEAERTREPQLKEALSLVSSCENINLLLNKSRFSGGDKKFGSYYGYGT